MRDQNRQYIDAIDARLPQTQCTQCGYDGCLPYAQAIAEDQADINRCPPGGQDTIVALSALTGQPILPLNPECGQTKPLMVAVVDESHCIGCALCIKACPVDAIVGANKRMHTVLSSWCTGCELCVAPCPVDCIDMIPVTDPALSWTTERADASRIRHQRLKARRQRQAAQALQAPDVTQHLPTSSGEPASKASVIAAALAKARQQRQSANRKSDSDCATPKST